MKTTQHYDVLSFYTDYKNRLSPQSLIGIFQDAATNQSSFLGVGFSYMQANHLIWVLLKYNIEIFRLPHFQEKIRVVTFPMYYERFYVYRKFEVYDERNNLIAYAYSTWTIVDVNTKKLCRITSDLIKAYGFTTKDRFSEKINFNPIPKLDSCDVETSFKIRYMDIDNNLHVNNTKYLAWAIETVPYEIVTKRDLTHVDIIYRKEIQYGHTVNIQSKINTYEDKTEIIHMITHENDLLCQLKTIWSSKPSE
jgi:medium-chain acyl-[acyl-carrier-protein] hydrolase